MKPAIPDKGGRNDGPSQVTERPGPPGPSRLPRLPPTTDFTSEFEPGASVNIDGDKSITAIVTAHLFRGLFVTCECSWFGNGAQQQAWIEEWRLRRAET